MFVAQKKEEGQKKYAIPGAYLDFPGITPTSLIVSSHTAPASAHDIRTRTFTYSIACLIHSSMDDWLNMDASLRLTRSLRD